MRCANAGCKGDILPNHPEIYYLQRPTLLLPFCHRACRDVYVGLRADYQKLLQGLLTEEYRDEEVDS